jgi:predicted transcriptional regulator of viral defense system
MKFEDVVLATKEQPCFRTSYLASGHPVAQVRLQLDRWEKAGKITKVTRGVYSLSSPYISMVPNSFAISSILRPASYVSLQSGLSFYGLIPEFVPGTMAVTVGRPWQVSSSLGRFAFRHIKASLFFGYEQQSLRDQYFFMATPEKALLDLLYFTSDSDSPAYIESLRLQNVNQLSLDVLHETAERMKSKKVDRGLKVVCSILDESDEEIEL